MNEFLDRISGLDKRQLILLADRLKKNLEFEHAKQDSPIAIRSMACRFPSSRNLAEYWDLLKSGSQGLQEVPRSRWDVRQYYDPDVGKAGKIYCTQGGFLEDIESFDPGFFGISPQEARRMDPQQRLLLETSWQAIENAGAARTISGSCTGVFVAISQSTYTGGMAVGRPQEIDVYSGAGNMCSTAAGRLSHLFGLRGPCIPIDTACSSSLVALHLAVESLRRRECDMALVAGVNLMLAPELSVYFCRLGVLSPTGQCRSFLANSDGYLRGEGCGAIVLQRLEDAQQEQAPILATVRGTAVNHDGRGSGLTVPNGKAQVEVIRRALANASLGAQDIDFLEGQGTATSIGDSIELQSIRSVFADQRQTPLRIGSVKANIGHLETASGMASLIKSCLSLQYKTFVPQPPINGAPNALIAQDAQLELCCSAAPWESEMPKRIGINGFGINGTNAHVILEEAPAVRENTAPQTKNPRTQSSVLCLSAHTSQALSELAYKAAETLEREPQIRWADFCVVGNQRQAGKYRKAIVAQDRSTALPRLGQLAQAVPSQPVESPAKIALVFSPHLSNDARSWLNTCVDSLGDVALASMLESFGELHDDPRHVFWLHRAVVALLEQFDLPIAAVMGIGLQEFTAGCVSGTLDWEEVDEKLAAGEASFSSDLEAGQNLKIRDAAERGWLCFESQEWFGGDADSIGPLSYSNSQMVPPEETAKRLQKIAELKLAGYAVIAIGDFPQELPTAWIRWLGSETESHNLGFSDLQAVLFEKGVDWSIPRPADWNSARWVNFPNTPFQRERFWIELKQLSSLEEQESEPPHQHERMRLKWQELQATPQSSSGKREQAIEFLCQCVAEHTSLPSAEFDLSASPRDLGIDSLAAAEIHHAIWSITGVRVPFSVMLQPSSISAIIDYVIDCPPEEVRSSKPLVRHPGLDCYRPTDAQVRYWFYQQVLPNTPVYNNVVAVRLRGTYTSDRLRSCLEGLTQEHEILRTSFQEFDDGVKAMVHSESRVPLETQVLATEEELKSWATNLARAAFDLKEGPLWRIGLAQMSSEDGVLVVVAHHIILDGWSLAILLQQILGDWLSPQSHGVTKHNEEKLEFSDYAVWYHENAASVDSESVQFWLKKFAETNPVLGLPTDYPRRIPTGQGKLAIRTLEPELIAQAEAIASARGTTLFAVMLSALSAALNRYSGQPTFHIGVPTAGRPFTELRDVLGMFMNTVAIPMDFTTATRWDDVLEKAIESTHAALEHQDVAFSRLIDLAEVPRDAIHTPLFQVLFAFQNLPFQKPDNDAILSSPYVVDPGTATFDLTLMVGFHESQAHCAWQYRSELYADDTISRLHDLFRSCLSSLVQQPQSRFDSQELVSASQKRRLLSLGQGEQALHSHLGLESLFERAAEAYPQRVALYFEDKIFTFAELQQASSRVAAQLRQRGITRGERVGLAVGRNVDMLIGMLGILKCGAAYVPLDIHYPAERLKYIIEDAELRLILTEEESRSSIPECAVTSVLVADLRKNDSDSGPVGEPDFSRRSDDLAYVLYTSGSTGKPKGVMVPHRVAMNRIETESIPIEPHETFCVQTSINFVDSIWEIFSTWRIGRPILLLGYAPATDLGNWLATLNKHQVTRLLMVPSMLRTLLDGDYDLSAQVPSLRRVICTGEPLPVDLVHRFIETAEDKELLNLYGTTETWDISQWSAERIGADSAPIGTPLPNIQVYVIDPKLTLAPEGANGELYVAGDGLSTGYWKRQALTATKYLPDPWSPIPGARMFRTGDLARWAIDGQLAFGGRRDDQLTVRGYRLEPAEIEIVLRELHAVRNAAVKLDSQGRLVAYCEPHAGETVSITELHKIAKRRLPEAIVPSHLVVMERLPLTPSGKIHRRALPDPDPTRPEIDQPFVAPRTETEQQVAKIWEQVLNLNRVGVHDDFFLLGGHSLLATQMISRVRETFAVDLPLQTVFEKPSISELAKQLDSGASRRSLAPITPAAEHQHVPVSYAQARLWFIDELYPGNSFYNLCGAIRVLGELDSSALANALQSIVNRHHILRTTFENSESGPVQSVLDSMPIGLEQADLSDLTPNARELELQRLLACEANRPFDLRTGPALRALLIRLGSQEHVFALTLHHMVADGWSIHVLVNELAHFYASHRQQVPSALPPLAIQFRDFCVWQRRRQQEPEIQQQLDWWLQQLQGIPDQLNLPTDSPRPEHSKYQGASIRRTLRRELSDGIKRLGEGQGTTPFMTMLTGWQVLLAKLSGQDRFSVGVPFANRLHSETESLIGLFANTLVFPADFSSDPTIENCLKSQRQLVIQGFEHQEVPFEELVEAINPVRDPSRTPLFQTAFIFQNAPLPKLRMPDGLTLEAMELSSTHCRFDLELHCWEQDGKLQLHLIYDTELYRDTTLHRWLEIYEYVMAQMATQPSLRISDIELLRQERQLELLESWNPPPVLSRPKLLHEFFEEQARRSPDQIAVVAGTEQLSYGELNTRASQFAHLLRNRGIRCGSYAAIFMPRTTDLIVALLGVLKSGAAYVPMDPTYPKERLQRMLDESRAKVICTSRSLVNELPPHSAQVVFVEESDQGSVPEPASVDRNSADELAYVIYTSGSTGQPKGVEIRHSGVAELVEWACEEIGSDAFSQTLVSTSICFDLFTLELYPTLATGGTAYLVESVLSAKDAKNFQELTFLSTVPSAAEELLRDSQFPPRLKMILLAGEPLPQRLVDRVRAATGAPTIRDIYGPSEDTTCSTSAVRRPNGPATIGRPIRNTRGYVLTPAMRLQPEGIVGELYLAGAGLARGYLRQARISAERFVPDPFAALPGQRMYRSGDLVFGNESGELFFQGRNDGQIKLRGFRVELSEIEYWLNQHPLIFQAAVCVVEHPTAGMRIAAFVVPEDRATGFEAVGTLDFLREKLPGFMLPAEFHTVEQLPRTTSGKLNRSALSELALRAVPTRIGDKTAPRTREEKILSELWCRVLGRDSIGVHENFFDLGGHSLLAVQIAHELRKQWRLNCSLPVLLRDPTIAGIATQLRPSESSFDLPADQYALRSSSKAGLSREQKMMWTLQLLSPESPMLNVPIAIRLPGKLEPPALQRAIYRLLDRHPVLRVRFEASEDGILQQIRPPAFQLEVGSYPAERDEELPTQSIDQLNRFASTPFDLGSAPLLRGLLLNSEGSEADCVLCLVSHHLVLDGWSVLVLLEDLLALYCEETNQSELFGSQWIAPSFSAVQFRDYTARQLTDEAILKSSAQCELLLHRIQQADLAVRLPVSRIRQATAGGTLDHRFSGARLNLDLNDSLVAKVESFASTQQTSEHSVYLAAFEVLLSRLCGKRVFTLGGVLAERDTPEVERLVGNLSRTIVYRADLSDAPDFCQIVKRVHDDLLWHSEHNQVYLDEVARALLKKQGNLVNNPVFDVMFTYQRVPIPPALHDVRWLEVDTGTSRVATTLSVIRVGDRAHCSWEYRTDLYQREDIGEFHRVFESLLANLIAEPKQSAFRPPLVVESCQQSMTSDRRTNVIRGARTAAPNLRIDDLIRLQAEKHGADIALHFQDGNLTYAEVLELSQSVAKHLPRLCKSSASIGVEMAPSPQALLIVLACFQARIRCVALSSSTPAKIQQQLVERLNVQCIISDQDREPGVACVKISSLEAIRNFGELVDRSIGLPSTSSSEIAERIASMPKAPHESGCIAVESTKYANANARGDFVFHTSGSSGIPKSVAFDHARVVNRIVTEFEPFADREVLCWKVRLDLVDSLWEMFAALCHGHSVAIVPAIAEAEIAQIIETLQEKKVTRYIFTPSLLRILLNHDPDLPRKLPWLRCWYIGGEPLPRDLVEDFLRAAPGESKLINGYGISEVWDATACSVTEDYQFGCVGKPWDNVEVMVLDSFLNLQPHDVTGEIHVAGEGLALGYVGQPGLTAASFVPNPFSSIPGSRLYRTGDLGLLDRDSNLFHLGRRDQQVSLHGQRIEAEGIEAVLRGHPDVHEAAVVVTQQGSQETLVAYIEPRVASISSDNLQTELRNSVSSQLPISHLPQRFVIEPSLPRTRSGKILRRELRERMLDAVRAVDDPPRSELELTIQSIWQEQLGILGGVHQNYFELGGDSLLAMQMLNRLRSEHDLHCPLARFFESPTIARLASFREVSEHTEGLSIANTTIPKREIVRSQNLLENQEQLWAIHELTAGMMPVNHLYLAGRLRAPLDFQLLQSAVASVVGRHEALRLRFELQDGKVRQRVEETGSDVCYCDLRSSSAPAAESKRLIIQEAIAPFDLSTEPPFRLVVNRLEDEVHDIAWIVHHLVADGWSMALLVSQLFESYLALAAGDSPGANSQPLGFLDYVDWYQQEPRIEQCERELEYWKANLVPTSTSVVPYDYPDSRHRDFAGALLEFGFAEDLTRAMKAFAKQSQTTLFCVLMTTLQVTVNRLSQTATNTILTASANRRRADFESIVGFLVNVVPIQVTIQASTRFSDLCGEVRQSIVDAFDHSLVSFDRVCALASEDGKHRLPSEIVMVLQKFPERPVPAFPGRLEPLPLDLGVTPFDINIALFDLGEALKGTLTYRSRRYDSQTIEAFVARWKKVAEQCIRDPNRTIGSLEILLDDEMEQLDEWGWQ